MKNDTKSKEEDSIKFPIPIAKINKYNQIIDKNSNFTLFENNVHINNKKELDISSFDMQNQKLKRNYGIDIARIVSMFLLINHHIMYHGGPMFGTKILSFENNLLLFLNTIFSSGVNVFGMISGFVGYHSHKYSNLIYLLLQTSMYNYFIPFCFNLIKPNIIKDLNHFLYPVFISSYWYFNAYFILYFFLPLINSGIKSMSKRELGIFNLSVFALFSCFNQIKHYSQRFKNDFFHLNNGFIYIWLLILYFYGSYFGRFNKNNHNFNKFIVALIYFIIICLVSYIRNVLIIYKLKNNKDVTQMRVEYTSPSSVIISLCLIIFFSKLNIEIKILQKTISFLSPLTYGIYLIHNHIIIMNYFIRNKYNWLLKYNVFKLLLLEMLESIKIFIICSFIDYFRLLFFNIFRIRKLCVVFSRLFGKVGKIILFLFETWY